MPLCMQRSHSWFYFLCAIEGAVAIAALLSISSEGGRLSADRLALISLICIICTAWIVLGFRRPHGLGLRFVRPTFIIICALLSLTFGLCLFLLRYLNPEGLLSTYERLSPLLWYLLVLSIQSSFFLLFLYKGFHPENLSSRKPVYLSALAAFCLLLLVFILVSLTRLGLTPDPAYWSEPGVPILGWQFALALISGACVLLLTFYVRTRAVDLFLPLIVYLLAVALWLSVPVSVLT